MSLVETAKDYFKRFKECNYQNEIVEYLKRYEKNISHLSVKNKKPVFEITAENYLSLID